MWKRVLNAPLSNNANYQKQISKPLNRYQDFTAVTDTQPTGELVSSLNIWEFTIFQWFREIHVFKKKKKPTILPIRLFFLF